MSVTFTVWEPRDAGSHRMGPIGTVYLSILCEAGELATYYQWEFQDPKMEVLYPYIGYIYIYMVGTFNFGS